jgi:hypothetical protein
LHLHHEPDIVELVEDSYLQGMTAIYDRQLRMNWAREKFQWRATVEHASTWKLSFSTSGSRGIRRRRIPGVEVDKLEFKRSKTRQSRRKKVLTVNNVEFYPKRQVL